MACWEAYVEDLLSAVLGRMILGAKDHKLFPREVLQRVASSHSGLRAWDLAGSGWKGALRGHLFPRHLEDGRAPQRFAHIFKNGKENFARYIQQELRPELFVLKLSYQRHTARAIEQAKSSGLKMVYNSVEHSEPPEPAENIIYIKPGWPMPDACVDLPGYDVDILPASGVVNALTYWSILSEASREQ